MATYLQGVTDYIPQIQPWTPDYNFYQGALERKQRQYDIGWEKTNTLYNSLLNAPMLRDDNIAKRDQFFQSIEQDINRLAEIDLSLPQNVDAAAQLFTPILDDKYILNDIGWTKRYQNELQTAERFRNCTDPEKCGGKYWEEGVRALNYMAEDFRNLDSNQALNMRAPKYVPFTNAAEKAFDKIKDSKFGTSIQTISPDGKWIVTEKNGANIIEPLTSYLASTIGNDPAVAEMYRTKAYVARKDWISANGGNFASPEEANQAYYSNMVLPSIAQTEEVNRDIKNTRKTREGEVAGFEKMIENEGIVPGSEEHTQYNAVMDEFQRLLQIEEQSDAILDQVSSIGTESNQQAMQYNSDFAVANAMFFNDMYGAAVNYHQLTYEQELKAEPYALAAYRENLSYNYGLLRDEAKYLLDRQLYIDKKIFDLQAEYDPKGFYFQNTIRTEDPGGDSTQETDDDNVANSWVKEENKIKNDVMYSKAQYLADMFNEFMVMETNDRDNVGWEMDFGHIFVDSGALKKVMGNKWDAYEKMGLNRMIEKLQTDGNSYIRPEDIQKLNAGEIDAMYKAMKSRLNPEVGVNKVKPWTDKMWNGNPEQDGKNYASKREEIKMVEEELELFKTAAVENWKDAEGDFKNMLLTGSVIDPGTLTTGGIGSDEFFETINRGDIVNTLNPKFRKDFANAIAENMVDESGQLVPLAQLQEAILEEAFPWYGQDPGAVMQNAEPGVNDWFDAGEAYWMETEGTKPIMVNGVPVDPKTGQPKPEMMDPRMQRQQYEQYAIANVRDIVEDMYYGTETKDSPTDYGLRDLHYKFWSRSDKVTNINSYLGGAGGMAAERMVADVDGHLYASANYQWSRGLFQDIRNLNGEYELAGDLGYMGFSKEIADNLITEFGDYVFTNKWEKDNLDRPKFTVKYLSTYKDPDKVQAKIYFDRKWIEDNAGSKKDPGLTRSGEDIMYNLADDGLTVLLPKNAMTNGFEQNSQVDRLDRIVRSTGFYDWKDRYPDAGDFQIRYDKNSQSYYTAGHVQYYDDVSGKLIKEPIPREYNEWMNDPYITFTEIKAHWEPMIRDLHWQNKNYEAWNKSVNGVKDKNELRGTNPDYNLVQ